jgi:hypothetical protein
MQLGWESDKKSGPFAELLLHETSLSAFNLSIHPWLIFRVQCQQHLPASVRLNYYYCKRTTRKKQQEECVRSIAFSFCQLCLSGNII